MRGKIYCFHTNPEGHDAMLRPFSCETSHTLITFIFGLYGNLLYRNSACEFIIACLKYWFIADFNGIAGPWIWWKWTRLIHRLRLSLLNHMNASIRYEIWSKVDRSIDRSIVQFKIVPVSWNDWTYGKSFVHRNRTQITLNLNKCLFLSLWLNRYECISQSDFTFNMFVSVYRLFT